MTAATRVLSQVRCARNSNPILEALHTDEESCRRTLIPTSMLSSSNTVFHFLSRRILLLQALSLPLQTFFLPLQMLSSSPDALLLSSQLLFHSLSRSRNATIQTTG
ncbi:uncharacterized protein LOC126629348 [Malus sylvestris]|uniref:uncharacterized protein LOC126629348 n=1 Tax=Malus sylvestris TaxID=3752 RepID=UPI0021AC0FFB|nr:uncharacterized protein LOC126629348 [Malus sylvestris]